jgi:predicted lipase
MANWVMPLFAAVVGVALFMQMLMFAAMFMAVRRLSQRVTRIADGLQSRVFPLVSRLEVWVEEVQPRVSGALYDASEMTHRARHQVERADRIVTEAADRLRMRIVDSDRVLTGVLESIEDAGFMIRRSVRTPVRSVRAMFRGIQTGFDFYRGRRRTEESDSVTRDWVPPFADIP